MVDTIDSLGSSLALRVDSVLLNGNKVLNMFSGPLLRIFQNIHGDIVLQVFLIFKMPCICNVLGLQSYAIY